MTERDYIMISTYKGFEIVDYERTKNPRYVGYSRGRVIIQTHNRSLLYRYLNTLVPADYETTVQDRIIDSRYITPLYTDKMKKLPSDDLSNNPDYNEHYKRYFPERHPDYAVEQPFWTGLFNRIGKWFKRSTDTRRL